MAAPKLDYIAEGLRPLAVKIGSVAIDPANAMGHPDENLEAIRGSLAKYGQRKPIVVNRNDNVIEAGNGAWVAAKALGWTHIAAVFVDDDPTMATGYAIADNRTAQLAIWDYETLARVLDEAFDEPTEIPGVSDAFLAEVMEEAGLAGQDQADDPGPQIDRAAELQEKWQVKTGDLWEIGAHRLVCGDCTDGAVVERVMSGEKIDAVFTDPPYGINRDPAWLDGVYPHRQVLSSRDVLAGDDGSLDLSFLWQYERRMVWGFPYIYDARSTGWIVWDKQPGVDGRGIVTPVEIASTTMRKGFDMIRVMWGGYYRAQGEGKQPHPTQKPIGVIAPFIAQWTQPGEVIADFFLGSGGVMVACEQLHRRCFGIEIEPKYCAVVLERLSAMELEPKRIQR